MKKRLALVTTSSIASLALLVGCSGAPATPADQAPGNGAPTAGAPATNTPGTTEPGTTPAPAASEPAAPAGGVTLPGTTVGETVDTDAFFNAMGEGMKAATTYTEVTTSQITLGESSTTLVTTTQVDVTDPAHYKAHSVTETDGTVDSESVIDGTTMYTKTEGGDWKSEELAGSVDELNSGLGEVGADVREAATVTYQGEEDVNGTSTRKYEVAIDMGGSIGTLTNTYWLDSRGIALKSVSGVGVAGSTNETIKTKIGEPVEIVVPQV
ncbi:MAG: hypothetical protein Q4F65_11845 [Propionibacteriaceae bacterium]|nr:hypothetical protein [Propionibacteriaceae bacterium]